ncbi:hypothetical protein Moror_779 [Moniliophthora roreri MCA 2997]|uniref:Uncharacterized protein n=1 Tax=Moniliophthora roreri (strain MCA 2997) TaxID=1381753 RepID=V2XAU3_MONRO|nr:hypothetical protein Moror_779 [Moniliophthora roreri MCA 2997]KAI3612774.1 hypothetical protein WG66_014630 [Moniliophthora roreri]
MKSKQTLLTLVSLLFCASTALAASSCVTFDSNWNLYAFGFDGKDYSAGTQDSWGSGSPEDITASGRPAFNTANVTCYLAQYYNAIYFLNADSSNPTSVYIYDAAAKSWSTQSVNPGGPDPANAVSILDHDTNVFYTMSNRQLSSLNMDNLKTKASPDAISWENVGNPSFSVDGYQPVMGLASNHIHFINVPGVGAGKADIFVIHFSYWQPETQTYSGDQFPAQHGQVASIFKDESWQLEFAYFPDDGSGTYIINVETNATKALPGIPSKDASATYAASTNTLVSSSSGGIQYMPYNPSGDNSGAQWTAVQKLASLKAAASTGSASGSGPSGSSSNKAHSANPTGTSSSGNTRTSGNGSGNTTTSGSNGAGALKAGREVVLGMMSALVLGSVGVFML